MPKGIRTCKICGNEYPYCKTERPTGLFRWQDVACCPEHAAEYFEQIAIARGEKIVEPKAEDPIVPDDSDELEDEEDEDDDE